MLLIIFGLLFVGSYYIRYYINHVMEYPDIYVHPSMEDILFKMKYLKQKIQWTPWAIHHYLQFMIYIWFTYRDIKIAKEIYTLETIRTSDEEDLVIAWGPSSSPKAVILFFHTLFGDYSESASFGNRMYQKHQWTPVSFSRRGHTNRLKQPFFNTVGHAKDVFIVVQSIKEKYPLLPIYAFGSSAGTAVLARYLGEYGKKSNIHGAVLLSAGYDFEKSQFTPYSIPDQLSIYRAKQFFLVQNRDVLEKYDKKIYDKLKTVTTIREWHQYQWLFAGEYQSPREYFLKHDPIHVIRQIQCPILYINAMDDFMFPSTLVKRFCTLVHECTNKVIIHTKRGSHLGFYEGWKPSSWAYKVSEEFLVQIYRR